MATTIRKRLLSKPCLILVLGVAGTGKSTLAREVLRRVWAVYLDNNHIADAFFPDTRNGPDYEKARPHFYQALYTIAEENLLLGNSVLLDVPHVKEVQTRQWRALIKRLARRSGSKLVVIRCFCPEKILRMRIRARREQRDRWKLQNWKEFLGQQPIQVPIPFSHLDMDTEKNLASNVSRAVHYIISQISQVGDIRRGLVSFSGRHSSGFASPRRRKARSGRTIS